MKFKNAKTTFYEMELKNKINKYLTSLYMDGVVIIFLWIDECEKYYHCEYKYINKSGDIIKDEKTLKKEILNNYE